MVGALELNIPISLASGCAVPRVVLKPAVSQLAKSDSSSWTVHGGVAVQNPKFLPVRSPSVIWIIKPGQKVPPALGGFALHRLTPKTGHQIIQMTSQLDDRRKLCTTQLRMYQTRNQAFGLWGCFGLAYL